MQEEISLDLLKNLLAYSSEAITFSDLNGIVRYANAAAEKLYGWEKGSLIGQSVDIFNSKETHSTEEIVEAIKSKSKWKGVLLQRRKDGSTFHSELTVTLILDESQNPIGFGSHSRDVTAAQQAQQELLESEEKYRRLFDNSQDGIVIHHNGEILEYNQRLCDIFGYTSEELSKLAVRDMIHPDDMHIVQEHIKNKSSEAYQHRGVHKDGSTLYFEVQGSNMHTAGKDTRVIMVHDITELKKQAEHIQSALKEKEVLLGEVYHRTKNNMQVISSLLSLRAEHVQDQSILEAFQEITDNIQSMSLVHQKLYESRNLSSIRLNEYIEDLTGLIYSSYENQTTQVHFILELAEVTVQIDTAMACGLILSELLSNAFKHAFVGRASGTILIKVHRDAYSNTHIVVKDDGVGASNLQQLEAKSGLGVRTIVGIVEHQLMGQIHFTSNKGLQCEIEFKDSQYKARV